jgi:chromosome segregation ATPase
MKVMTAEHWETLRAILIVLGGLATGVVTSKVTRKSQKESSNIALATDLINQVQEEREEVKDDLKETKLDLKSSNEENKQLRRYIRQLRSQIYELGGKPIEADKELGI